MQPHGDLKTTLFRVIRGVEFNGHGLQPLHGVQGQIGGNLEPVQPHGALKTPSLGLSRGKGMKVVIGMTDFSENYELVLHCRKYSLQTHATLN